MQSSGLQVDQGVKIIDFSEVPSDILSLMVSLAGRIIVSIQQWIEKEKRHPIAIFVMKLIYTYWKRQTIYLKLQDFKTSNGLLKRLENTELGVVFISQRPSEVNRAILSQSSNSIAMRLTNAEDQPVIKRMLPDSLGGFPELLPISYFFPSAVVVQQNTELAKI